MNRQRESGEEITSAGVTKGKKCVGMADPRRGAERPPEGMLVVKGARGEKREKAGEMTSRWCENRSEKEQLKLSPMDETCGEIKVGQRKAEEDDRESLQLPLLVSLQLTRKELERMSRKLKVR